jgi:predicted GNAT family N-acyltransferase
MELDGVGWSWMELDKADTHYSLFIIHHSLFTIHHSPFTLPTPSLSLLLFYACMNPITLKRIDIHAPEYPQVWTLREEILRRPLGMSLNDEDLSKEAEEYIIIALQQEIVIGCVMLRPISTDRLKLRQMAVAENFQGKGVGAAIVAGAEHLATELGVPYISLHARMEAVPFYERCGYERVGVEFTEVGIPHLLMQKRLS